MNSSTAETFLSYVQRSPSPFHAVSTTMGALLGAGFQEIKERNLWRLSGDGTSATTTTTTHQLCRGGKYFFTRNKSSIIAFTIGGGWEGATGATGGISIIGAHTDSPCLKVKPRSARPPKGGCIQVGMETYGGGLWGTWFDRDLSLAGRALVEQGSNPSTFEHRLVDLKQPILRIPTLAIHLDRNAGDNFTFNKETHLTPVLALVASTDPLFTATPPSSSGNNASTRHHPLLLDLMAKSLNCEAAAIGDFELCAYDTQPPAFGGANKEFIHSARLDNLMMSFCSLTALIDFASTPNAIESSKNIQMICLFDNEEVGSQSAYGADSNLLEVTLKRLCALSVSGGASTVPESEAFSRVMARSLLISADMAHASHPNYPEKHEDAHRPTMNQGIVVKQNANQRYATTSLTTHVLRQAAKHAGIPVQEFVVRNDSPCGSTIGPMLSAKLGLATVDVGIAQWSMHSIREVCGAQDVGAAVALFKAYFTHYSAIHDGLRVDGE